MGSKMKGIYKGFKYSLSQLFASKEREMEIGNPTDVKHVAHIGWDGPSGSAAPSWMSEFKTGHDFAATSCGRSALPPWPSSQDFEVSMQHHEFESKGAFAEDLKKTGRKKSLSSSSPRFFGSSFSGKASTLKSKMCRNESRLHRHQASLDV